jgi:two-component system, chemotaxis family, sensor histidine kinase and response regulator PixL
MATGQTVLVVEDDETVRQGLAVVLEQAGYVVVTAANGREALTYPRSHLPPALILLDMMMPAADGWHFMRLRARDALASVPVLIMTAIGVASQEWATSLGVVGYLRKPVAEDELVEAVGATLARLSGAALSNPGLT